MQNEAVILVGLQTDESDQHFIYSMEELERLVDTANGKVVLVMTQKRAEIDSRTFIGKGKLSELEVAVDQHEASTVIFNQPLSPSQVRNIQDKVDAKIIDRMQLILDIFAMRANSKEGRLQVELAQQEYLLPRLAGQGVNLSRLGGGIGTRGPGETQLESDRRYIQNRISDIKKELKKVGAHRERNRQRRQDRQVFQIGLIGYTNAGKSTLLNVLTQEEALEENALFATLDPLTRQLPMAEGMQATLTDTVGFIQDLPTELVASFQSTLEESRNMDLILHVVDASSDYADLQEDTVLRLLKEMEIDHLPRLTVYNKMDLASSSFVPQLHPRVLISAKDPEDIDKLEKSIHKAMKEALRYFKIEIPAEQADLLYQIRSESLVESLDYDEKTASYELTGYAKDSAPWLPA